MRTKIIAIIVVSVCLMLVSGCMQRQSIVKDRYLVQAQWAGEAGSVSDDVMTVMPFTIAPAFGSNGFVYRTGQSKFETDYYNEYFVPPAQMLTQQTQRWLTASGIAQVMPATSTVEAKYILEGNVRQLYADFRDKTQSKAEMEIFFVLIEQNRQGGQIQLSKTYTASIAISDNTAVNTIEALDECLGQVLTALEKDIRELASD